MKKGAYMNDRHALVAGGAGFVGSHLCTRLLDMGYGKVTCLDNLSTGRLSNIEDLMDNPRFVFIQGDVTERIGIGEEISEIYNLACPASPEQYRKNPVGTFKASVIGSINLLELAHDRKARILLASTSEVYGDPQIPIQDESYHGNVNPYGTRSCYDEGKRGAETLFHDYHHTLGVDTRIIRIFNTYGPHMSTDDGRVVSNFIVQALRREPLTIYGDGSQTRSFQYISDLIDAMTAVMRDGVTHSPINIGNPNETTIGDLARMIIQMTGSSSELTYHPLPQDDPCRRCPDISLARRMPGGWTPGVGLSDGLLKTIEYFRNSPGI